MPILLGGLETGGTTFKLSLAYDIPTNVIHQYSIPTESPESTLAIVAKQFYEWNVDCIGIASFGPIDLLPNSPTYGYITTTPKEQWQHTNVIGILRSQLVELAQNDPFNNPNFQDITMEQCREETIEKYAKLKIGWNTDVNAAAAAELLYGEHNDVNSLAYITIGTGIGIGIAIDLNNSAQLTTTDPSLLTATQRNVFMITNMLHPEGGHIPVHRYKDEIATQKSVCPFHLSCCEGFANMQATANRISIEPDQLPTVCDESITWQATAYYIAQLCQTLIYTVSPQRIIIGGGLSHSTVLMKHIRSFVTELNNGYVNTKELAMIDSFIQTSKFDQDGSKTSPGAVGALWLAYNIYHTK